MNKTTQIDLSRDRFLDIASDMVDEHNYIGALKMLNKNAEINCSDEDCFMLYAEIFDDMGLYEKCINNWFKFIDSTFSDDLMEAYEGLAVAYMNLGNEHFSAYYYNKLLVDTQEIDAEMRGEILNSFLERTPSPLKFVYPPKIADCSEIMNGGIDLMRKGEYDKAIAEFENIDAENEAYLTARNYIAMCNIICDRPELAERECLALLEKYPDNVQALTTLAAVKTEQKKPEESKQLAKRLLNIKNVSTEEIYKIATVCCENGMHEEAFNQFEKLDGELIYDQTILFFKAVSAFNCGKFSECFSAFDTLVAINPDSVTARYFYALARRKAESGDVSELSYFYRMPQSDRENTLKLLATLSKLSPAEMCKISEIADITDCVLWSFDEPDVSNENELQTLAMTCAVKARLDVLVCDVLLNAFLSDSLKVDILTMLGERNEENTFGVVICHLYRRLSFHRIDVGRLKRKNFVKAYAMLTAHFGILDEGNSEKFAMACEQLYKKLEKAGKLGCASDVNSLVAAVFYFSGESEKHFKRDKLSSFFDASEKKIAEILGEL